jgi:hypothetical protein
MRCDSAIAIAKHDLANCERGQEREGENVRASMQGRGQERNVKCEDGGSEVSDSNEGWKGRG